jgi:hypothetical protein
MAADKINFSAPRGAHLLDVMIGDKQCGDRVQRRCFVITTNSSPHKIVNSKDDIIRNEKLPPAKYKSNN